MRVDGGWWIWGEINEAKRSDMDGWMDGNACMASARDPSTVLLVVLSSIDSSEVVLVIQVAGSQIV